MNENRKSIEGESGLVSEGTGAGAPEPLAVPIRNKHVEAVLDGEESQAFASSYEHFSSFLSWTRTGG